jgi:hypothetical protein
VYIFTLEESRWDNGMTESALIKFITFVNSIILDVSKISIYSYLHVIKYLELVALFVQFDRLLNSRIF